MFCQANVQNACFNPNHPWHLVVQNTLHIEVADMQESQETPEFFDNIKAGQFTFNRIVLLKLIGAAECKGFLAKNDLFRSQT